MTEDPIWTWDRADIVAHYTEGHCHVFAAAMQSLTGYSMWIMWNPFEWHIEPDARGRGGVREVIHVFLRAPDGSVIDIKGRRSLEKMKRDMAPHDWEACPCGPLSPARLSELINDSENLVPFSEDEVQEALEVIDRTPSLALIVRKLRRAEKRGRRPRKAA